MKWFTSDLHLMQKNIVTKLSNWAHADPDTLRDFEDQVEMSNYIIDNINKYVDKKDELYILGDLYFGKDKGELYDFICRIKCVNKYLIFGNHDYLVRDNLEFFQPLFRHMSNYMEFNTKYPLPGTDPNRDPWKGSQFIVMSHYAMRVWNRSHKGSWMLYGHSHGSLDNVDKQKDAKGRMINEFYKSKRTIDVGVDNAKVILGDYRPFSFEELLDIMNKKDEIYIDHHEKRA